MAIAFLDITDCWHGIDYSPTTQHAVPEQQRFHLWNDIQYHLSTRQGFGQRDTCRLESSRRVAIALQREIHHYENQQQRIG